MLKRALVVLSLLLLAVPALANSPPVADAGPDQSIYTGDTTYVNGSATDPDGDAIIIWNWTIADAPADSDWRLFYSDRPNALFAGITPGDFVLSLRVFDEHYTASAPDTVTIHVADNLPPVAIATADKTSGTAPLTVCFDGTQSYDPEGGPLVYDWDLGDAGAAAQTPTVCHTYNSAGFYNVLFIVGDERNGFDSDTIPITVMGPPPEGMPYDNTTNQVGSWRPICQPGIQNTAGDDVTLAGTERTVTGIDILIFSSMSPSSGTVDAQVRFFANDGPDGGPGTLIWNSGVVQDIPYHELENTFSFVVPSVTVPDAFIWTITLSDVQTGDGFYNLGPILYAPPTVGSSAGITWMYYAFPSTPTTYTGPNESYGARIHTGTPNIAPVLEPVGSSWVYEGTPLKFTLQASDADGDLLTYYGKDLPTGATLNSDTGRFDWTPDDNQAGKYVVGFAVTDGYLQDAETVTIIVYEGHGPPLEQRVVKSKQATLIGEKLEVTYTKEELASTFDVNAAFTGMTPETAYVTVTTFKQCPDSPVGFQVGDTCFDIATDATAFDSVRICVTYDESTLTSEQSLKLEHYEDGKWKNITTEQDVDKNIICGTSNSLSPLAVVKSVNDITAPAEPVAVNTSVAVSASFIDQNTLSNHHAEINWGDGTTTSGTIDEMDGSGTASGSHAYTVAGVYSITLTVYDNEDTPLGASVYRYVVVYDADGGFVTGGGWINSPVGAYAADPLLTGKASFGFVSKYKKGATTPTGNTEFEFKAGGLLFRSDSYDWLVVAGPQAKYKGEGTINGMGEYGFMLTAIDGALAKDDGCDRFRIKIWDKATDAIVYDNLMGSEDDAVPTTTLGGGSIVIHKAK